MSGPPSTLDLAFALYGIPRSAKLVLLEMARVGNVSGECFASQKRLAKMSCSTDRNVRTALAYLRDHGFIQRIANPGRRTSNYLLLTKRWGVECGKIDRPTGKNLPHPSGKTVRQNQNLNQNLNQGRQSSRSMRRVDEEIGQVLGNMERLLAKRDGEESVDA